MVQTSRITVSYGIATSTNTADLTAMIAAADSAPYQAKNLDRFFQMV
ncbi:hypothetical protein GCM10023346_40430 [Arthrobacter gyeryongensis]|uniref:GGDEF domain-containing protein n=1 Tax=Arthrobacter gyeryongensis TaxID=1650592 RepID=A0ABP9SR90_9MICC